MVLVDGDGMTVSQYFYASLKLFHINTLQFTDGILKAENGVEKAATQLLTGVKEAVKQFYGKDEGSSEWKIKVKIYANIAGLHRTFVKAAITESFDRFSVNFNQQHPMLEFIDVGEGKEKADTQIRGRPNYSFKQATPFNMPVQSISIGTWRITIAGQYSLLHPTTAAMQEI